MKCNCCTKEATADWHPWPEPKLPLEPVQRNTRNRARIHLCPDCQVNLNGTHNQRANFYFTYRGQLFYYNGKHAPRSPYLWHGGTSTDEHGRTFEMICRDLPPIGKDRHHEIVAHIYEPGLAQAIIDNNNKSI